MVEYLKQWMQNDAKVQVTMNMVDHGRYEDVALVMVDDVGIVVNTGGRGSLEHAIPFSAIASIMKTSRP